MTHWRYHLGVHKTATTHLQRVLQSQRERMLAKGIHYMPLEELRAATAPAFQAKAFGRTKFRRAVRAAAAVAILSEENWIGHSYEACVFPIYPRLERRLRIVWQPNVSVFISIRNPADFAASVYSEAMRHFPDKVSLAATRDAFLAGGSPWLSVIERIKAIFPQLQVWRYEDYRGNEGAYISRVAGAPVVVPDIAEPEETQRLPAETIEALERMRTVGERVPLAGTLAPPAKPTRLEIFSDQERAELTKSYNHDVDTLRRMGVLI